MDQREIILIQSYIHEKKTLAESCKLAHMKPKTAHQILIKNGYQVRGKNDLRAKNLNLEQLKELYQVENKTTFEIADILDVSHGTVNNYITKYRLNNKNCVQSRALRSQNYTLWTDEKKQHAKELLEAGLSYAEAGEKLGVSKLAVENLNRSQLHVTRSIWTDENIKMARESLQKNKSFSQTANELGVQEQKLKYANNRILHVNLSENSTCFGIPTVYNGQNYRSKSEAEIAHELTKHQIKFEYEKKVKEEFLWTCDFYLPDYNLWIEYDGLERARTLTKSIDYGSGNPKIEFYKQNKINYYILPKRWKKELEDLIKMVKE